jgi:hypothetical protein
MSSIARTSAIVFMILTTKGLHMKIAAAFVLLLGINQVTSAADALPPGAVKRGTLANAKLVEDAKTGVASKVATLGCSSLGDVDPYVLVMPTGAAGHRSWKELWIVSGCSKQYPVTIEFVTNGPDADWTIR